jgi:uncharacterized protein YunC (DUF1805 family)
MVMVSMVPVPLDSGTAVGITVELPRTRLVILAGSRGYLMCGALDVAMLDSGHLRAREIAAARAVGVRTLEDLLAAPVQAATAAARVLGVEVGMPGREAIARLL